MKLQKTSSSLRARPAVTKLESRITPTNVAHYHNDVQSTGVNLNETTLTRANVAYTTFGKNFMVQVDGQVYAQPLVMQGVNITTGANQGVHDVVFVATQHDTLYAIDASDNAGLILWQRTFLTSGLPGATSITTVPQADVLTSDITVEIGITGTPVIDTATSRLYLVAKTKETVSGTAHYVQRVYGINLQDGTNAMAPFLISDTTYNGSTYTNNTSIFVYGNGDGSSSDIYYGTGNLVVPFNALREHQRAALTLVNGVIYVAWASHGDNGPYHGWIVGFDKNDLHLTSVLNTTPNGGLGGIWMAGGTLTYDGAYFYCETGNGTFTPYNGSDTANNPTAPAPGPITGLNAQGFPNDACYGDSFLKVGLDGTTTSKNQNPNGWGLKVVDYFTPFNEQYLDQRDLDVGSAAPLVLPDTVGSAAHPHLLIGSGKEGVIYLLDRDNMGKFGLSNNIVQNTANQLSGSLDTAAHYNGRIYYVEGYGGTAKTFTISNGAISVIPETRSKDSYAFAGSTPSISANNNTDGIVWDIDRGTNELRAYSTDSYATELYTSSQAPNNRDALGGAVKFQVPTIANGHVYVGSGTGNPNNYLVVYGLIAPPTQPPAAPSNLSASAVSATQINLTWINNDTSPNIADSYLVERSPNGTSGWTQIASVTGTNSYAVGSLTAATTYFFRVRAHNIIGDSPYTSVASATTYASSTHSINFPTGFTGAASSFTFNNYGSGTKITSSGRLRLTSGANNQSRSSFFNTQQNISFFTTTFQYTKTGAADGATFVIQRDPRGLTAIGEGGGLLAYGATTTPANRINPSFALAFNMYSGNPVGTEFLTNGIVDFKYTQSTINVALDNTPITVVLTYAAGSMTAQFTQGANSETKTFNVDLPTLLGANTAYVGFTGATGGAASTQDIINWTFDQGTPPAVPTNPQASVTGYTSGSTQAVPLGSHVTWTPAPGASGYKIERKLGVGGMYSQVGTANIANFDDTGLATQSTYYYRIRATNIAGDSAYSSEVSIITPALAPTPTNGQMTSATTTSIAMQWTDNANNEDGFQIFRAIGGGTFAFVISLPASIAAAPAVVTWTDTGLTPGTHYDYHIQAFNLSGYSDFTGVSTATKTLAPSGLMATPNVGNVDLSWTAPTGAATYKIYRSAAVGGPFNQIASGVTATGYTDTTALVGTNYYQVTAVDLGGESSPSNMASATITPAIVTGVAINDGAVYRSVVRSVTVTFDRIVSITGLPDTAFVLNGPFGIVTVSVSLTGSTATQTIARLTFPVQSSVEFGSLRDGRYTLTALASQLSANGAGLDGNADGTPGDDYTLASSGTSGVFRLFGDFDGNAIVDGLDFGYFRASFNTNDPAVDFNGDGLVDGLDFGEFRSRFGQMI